MMRLVLVAVLSGCSPTLAVENVAELPEAPRCAAPSKPCRLGCCQPEAEHPRE